MSAKSSSPDDLLDALIQRSSSAATPAQMRFDEQVLASLAEAVERRAVSHTADAIGGGRLLVAITDESGHRELAARARRALAQALAYAGQLDESLRLAGEGNRIAAEARATVEAARCRLAAIHPLAALGRYDEAIAAGEEARAALLGAGESGLAARADLNLGAVFAMRDDPRRALAYLDRARPSFDSEPSILAQLETNRGNALAAIDDHAGAWRAFASAARAFEAGGQVLAAAIAAGNLGHLAARRGDIPRALEHFERSRLMLDSIDADAHRARLLTEHAAVIASLGLPGEALETLDETIPLLDAMGLVVESARARLIAGRSAVELGRVANALEYLERAADQLAGTGQPSLLAETDRLRARLRLLEGDGPGAVQLASNAWETTSDRPVDRCLAAALLCRIAIQRGDFATAQRWLTSAFDDAQRLDLAPLRAELYLLEGQLRREVGRSARAAFAAAVEETERIRKTLQAARFRSAFHADRLAPYVELMRSILDEGGEVDQAFVTSELLKSRTLIDVVGRDDDREDENHPLGLEMTKIRTELNWRYSRVDSDPTELDRTELRALERQLAEIESRLAVLHEQDPASNSPASACEIQDSLAPGDTAIAYVIAGDEVLAFVVRPDSVHVTRGLCDIHELLDAIRRLRLQIARVRSSHMPVGRVARMTIDVQRELHRLWSLLIAPVLPQLAGASRLVLAPHGPLHTVPFAALWDGTAYVVERFEVNQVPSLSLFARLQGQSVPAEGRVLIVGVSDELAPHIPAEVDLVANLLPGSIVTRESSATTTAVEQAIGQAELIHLACHGRYLREVPGASGLKLADGWLTLDRIARGRLRGAHVTLSACETGRATVEAGDELIGLTRAFYSAGARSLIVSLWAIHDESAAVVMERLYRRVVEGSTFGSALRAAQVSAIGDGEHPARWAAFAYGGR